jgi:mannose-6-phosphate isomerase-like protein (cupin superfamily)
VSHHNITHWDDVEEHDHEEGSIHSAWRYLGEAAGTVGVGVNRIRIHPGCRSTPLHSHGDHEEIFFVLGGTGLSWQRTERGEDVVYEVGPGTCLVHLATGPRAAGAQTLPVFTFGRTSSAPTRSSPPRSRMRRRPLAACGDALAERHR